MTTKKVLFAGGTGIVGRSAVDWFRQRNAVVPVLVGGRNLELSSEIAVATAIADRDWESLDTGGRIFAKLERMLPRSVASLVVCLGLCAPFVACVGDDPAAPAPGGRLGSCNPDGTCAAGLTCAAQERICVSTEPTAPDAGPVDTDRDGAVADAASTDATGTDAGDASELRCGLGAASDVACPDAPCSDPIETCCIDGVTGTHTCARNCGASAKAFECDTREACGNDTHCCAEVTQEATGAACASRVELAYAMCLQSCSSQRAACRKDTDCAGTGATCVLTEVVLAPGVVRVWGLCSSQ